MLFFFSYCWATKEGEKATRKWEPYQSVFNGSFSSSPCCSRNSRYSSGPYPKIIHVSPSFLKIYFLQIINRNSCQTTNNLAAFAFDTSGVFLFLEHFPVSQPEFRLWNCKFQHHSEFFLISTPALGVAQGYSLCCWWTCRVF